MSDLHIERRVLRIIERLYLPLGVKLSPDTKFFDELQFDFDKLYELRDECEAEFDLFIPDEWLTGLATVAGLIDTIRRLKTP